VSNWNSRVRAIFCKCLGLEDVDLRASLAYLGADSLDLLDLRFQIAHEFGRHIPAAWLRPGRTGLDVLAYLRGAAASEAVLQSNH
jgi:acyl carrier protein